MKKHLLMTLLSIPYILMSIASFEAFEYPMNLFPVSMLMFVWTFALVSVYHDEFNNLK